MPGRTFGTILAFACWRRRAHDCPFPAAMDFNIADLHINWVDFLVVIVVLTGIVRGRKRGISQELLDVVKWLLVVVVAAYSYEPMGQLLAHYSYFSDLCCYVTVYTLIIAGFM